MHVRYRLVSRKLQADISLYCWRNNGNTNVFKR